MATKVCYPATSYIASLTPDTNYNDVRDYAGRITATDRANCRIFGVFNDLPAASAVSAAEFYFYYREAGDSTSRTLTFARTTSAHTETGVTWNNQPGVDGTALGSIVLAADVGAKQLSFNTTETLELLQSGFGFRIINSNELNDYSYKGLDSDEGTVPPYLYLTYTPRSGSQVICLFSKIQDFYDKLKHGLIPANELKRRYKEVLETKKLVMG